MTEKLYLTYQNAFITDPAQKKVTDQSVIKEIEKMGLSVEKVDFKYDYSKEFPVSKMYQVNDPESPHHKNHIVAISQLPMVNVNGEKCSPKWIKNKDGSYFSDKNQFEVIVEDTRVELTRINDQADGNKNRDKTSWDPKLFLDDKEVLCLSGPNLLEVDPINNNYNYNVLEYDYGICKRWLRLIEGRFLERWIFEKNPGGTVRVNHGFTGPRLHLGQYAIDPDTEQVTVEQFAHAQYPFQISATGTFYPDANPETTTVDGYVRRHSVNETWSTLIVSAGNQVQDDGLVSIRTDFSSTATVDRYLNCHRAILLFDTSSLPDDATINSATLSIAINEKWSSAGIYVVPGYASANTVLHPWYFENIGTTNLGYISGDDIPELAGTYTDIPLNGDGISQINKTGISKFGLRNSYDFTGGNPPWEYPYHGGVRCRAAEYGDPCKPKLVVIYNTPTALLSPQAQQQIEQKIQQL